MDECCGKSDRNVSGKRYPDVLDNLDVVHKYAWSH